VKLHEFKKGMVVRDRWWTDRVFTVKKVLKTRVHLERWGEITVYDLPHLQFLERV
jgi:hypothetical protein